MDRDEELNYELQRIRDSIREETLSLQKTATGLWDGRSNDSKDEGGREKLLKMLKERRQKLEKETSEREKDGLAASSSTSSHENKLLETPRDGGGGTPTSSAS